MTNRLLNAMAAGEKFLKNHLGGTLLVDTFKIQKKKKKKGGGDVGGGLKYTKLIN